MYPNQPRSQGGWPDQPPQYSGRPGDDEARFGPGQRQEVRPLPPRRRRRRGWIGLLIVLVVLAVLFVIGDQVAKAYAQNTIASKIESSSG